MFVYYTSSTESRPCVVCGKKTGTYKKYHQSNMDISIPLCSRDGVESCYDKVDVKKICSSFLIDLKKAVKVSK